jgi:hypothetical protein
MGWKIGERPHVPSEEEGPKLAKERKAEKKHEKKADIVFEQKKEARTVEPQKGPSLQEKRTKKLERSNVVRAEKISKVSKPFLGKPTGVPRAKPEQAKSEIEVLAKNILRLKEAHFVKVMQALETRSPTAFKNLLQELHLSPKAIEMLLSFLPIMQHEEIDDTVDSLFKVLKVLSLAHQEKFVQFLGTKIEDPELAKKFLEAFRVEQGLRALQEFDE